MRTAGWSFKAPQRWPLVGTSYLRRDAARVLGEVERAPRDYRDPPRMEGDQLTATLSLGDEPCAVTVQVHRQFRTVVLLATGSCGRSRCPHAIALLADLALFDELARALAAGKDTTELVRELAPRRAADLSAAAVESGFRAWLDVPRPRAPVPCRWVLTPRWRNESWGGEPRDDSLPVLDVSVLLAGRKTPLAAADVPTAPLLDEDRELLESCTAPSQGFRDGLGAVGGAGARLLARLEHREVHLVTGERLAFHGFAVVPRVVNRRVPRSWTEGPRLRPHDVTDTDEQVDAMVAEWCTPGGDVVVPMTRTFYFPGRDGRVLLLDRAACVRVAPGVDAQVALALQRVPVVRLRPEAPVEAVAGALQRAWRGRGVVMDVPEALPGGTSGAVTWLGVDGSPLELRARLVAEYSFGTWDLRPNAPSTDLRRDSAAEAAAVAAVEAVGFEWDSGSRAFLAAGDDAARFWMTGIPGVEVRVASSSRPPKFRGPLVPHMQVSLLEGSLLPRVSLEAEGVMAAIQDVERALRSRRRFVVLGDDSLAEIRDDVRALLNDLVLHRDVSSPASRSSNAAVHAWLQRVESAPPDGPARTLVDALAAGAPEEPVIPNGFRLDLRPYQRAGLAWLQWLARVGAGGVLADDMGLGKTIQVLAWLQGLHAEKPRPAHPSLVLCPTSVATQWQEEAARATSLRVHVFHGEDRVRTWPECDVVVTTYGVLRHDATFLAERDWHALVVDEAQLLKNADAVTTRVVRQLRARHRVALTGTPMENRPLDLWTVSDLVNRGLLGGREHFQVLTEPAIMRDREGPEARDVRARIRPYLLRRTKAAVLSDLPPRTDIDLAVLPTREQRRFYDGVAASARSEVQRVLKDKGKDHARITALAALTRLRQVACDPRLVDPSLPAEYGAKRTEFLHRMETLVAEGRRVLVFSSFVELLTLWRRDLVGMGIRHEYLDGATRARADVVKRFQQGDAPAMLISLKAGGTGLNLAAADTVILCDPWWNPAVENQAADRAHRMGQERPVTVYRAWVRGTVEEKILQLKDRKRVLADALLRPGDEPRADPLAALELLSDADVPVEDDA